MKASFPALAGTFLLVPRLDEDDFLHVDRVPILGWSNFAEKPDDVPNLRTSCTPVVPYWPEGVSQAAAYQIPLPFSQTKQDFAICVPFAKRSFESESAYQHFAETVLRELAGEETSIDPVFHEAAVAALAGTRDEGVDKSIGLFFNGMAFKLADPGEDAREYGKSNHGQRRTGDEIQDDATYLRAIEATGKTIRAANTQWKKTPSRSAVLVALGWLRDAEAPRADAPVYEDDDADLLG